MADVCNIRAVNDGDIIVVRGVYGRTTQSYRYQLARMESHAVEGADEYSHNNTPAILCAIVVSSYRTDPKDNCDTCSTGNRDEQFYPLPWNQKILHEIWENLDPEDQGWSTLADLRKWVGMEVGYRERFEREVDAEVQRRLVALGSNGCSDNRSLCTSD